jgi:23S rRNA (pseudouridine1915-N3)-methyltransferase
LIIHIIVIGKTKDARLRDLQRTYLDRLRKYTRTDFLTLREGKPSYRPDILRAEGERILRRLHSGDFVVVLDSRGKEFSSQRLSDFLQHHMVAGTKRVVFVVGGPQGLDMIVKERADLRLSFSRFTFTHEMIRVLLLEQLYRAWTLIRGEKYHK